MQKASATQIKQLQWEKHSNEGKHVTWKARVQKLIQYLINVEQKSDVSQPEVKLAGLGYPCQQYGGIGKVGDSTWL